MDELGVVLLVSGRDGVPDLADGLAAAGYACATARLEEVLASEPTAPDAVVVDASCSAAARAAVAEHLAAAGAAPTVLVATAGDPALVEPHLADGIDALLPPFTPPLVRARVERARELTRATTQQLSVADLHAARAEQELQIGRDIQLGFLPEHLPEPPGWDVAARFRPAREVAGDFYDAFEMVNGRRIGFVVADVCDKGVGAALFMALIRTLVRSGAQQNVSLSWVGDEGDGGGVAWPALTRGQRRTAPTMGTGPLLHAVAGANRYMTENHLAQGYFATMFFGMLDPRTGSLHYINGGHNPPAVLRADGTRESLPPTGPAVGMLPGGTFRIAETHLEPGDTLFAYTDGVPEAKDADGAFFTNARMYALLDEPVPSSAGLLDRIDGSVRAFVGDAPPFDDITMMAVRRLTA